MLSLPFSKFLLLSIKGSFLAHHTFVGIICWWYYAEASLQWKLVATFVLRKRFSAVIIAHPAAISKQTSTSEDFNLRYRARGEATLNGLSTEGEGAGSAETQHFCRSASPAVAWQAVGSRSELEEGCCLICTGQDKLDTPLGACEGWSLGGVRVWI